MKNRYAPLSLRIRWLGPPLCAVALAQLCFAVYAWLWAEGAGSTIFFGLGATGLSLAVFGLHHDSGLSRALAEQRRGQSLAPWLERELDLWKRENLQDLKSLQDTPKTAAFVLLLASALHGLLVHLQGWMGLA